MEPKKLSLCHWYTVAARFCDRLWAAEWMTQGEKHTNVVYILLTEDFLKIHDLEQDYDMAVNALLEWMYAVKLSATDICKRNKPS